MRLARLRMVCFLAVTSFVAPSPARLNASCADPEECLRDAKAAVAARYHTAFNSDSRDVHLLSVILGKLREQHAQARLPAEVLEAETRLWGTVYGEVVRSVHVACWSPSRERKRPYQHVLRIDCRADWEWDVVALARRLITEPLSPVRDEMEPQVTIEWMLNLHLLD
jgi:hypothetical protein